VILRRAPAAARRRLDSAEYVVAWAAPQAGSADAPLVVTNLGIWWPAGSDARRIGWERVDKAVWSDDTLTLTVTEADVVDDLLLVERRPVSVRLPSPGSVPPAVRKRVESTVAHRHQAIVDGQMVRIVARRVPGHDGLRWWARLPADVPDTPEIRAYLRAVIGRLRGAEADLDL
jgi:hypothetical protein